jgi:hypothetical protein
MRRQGTEAPEVRDLPADGAARDRFEAWLVAPIEAAVPAIGLEMLRVMGFLGTIERRAWQDTETTPVRRAGRASSLRTYDMRILYRLAPADVRRVRAAAIAAIEAAGGRVELGATVATVAAGELRISMA